MSLTQLALRCNIDPKTIATTIENLKDREQWDWATPDSYGTTYITSLEMVDGKLKMHGYFYQRCWYTGKLVDEGPIGGK